MKLKEALGESLLRRRLGLPSAFTTTRSGRRAAGSQSRRKDYRLQLSSQRPSQLQSMTTWNDERSVKVRWSKAAVGDQRGDSWTQKDELVVERFLPDHRCPVRSQAAESDLRSRGRYRTRREPTRTVGWRSCGDPFRHSKGATPMVAKPKPTDRGRGQGRRLRQVRRVRYPAKSRAAVPASGSRPRSGRVHPERQGGDQRNGRVGWR